MTLSARSWLVRWAYLFEWIPSTTTLCAFLWRSVLLTPLKLGLPPGVVGVVAYGAYTDPKGFLSFLLMLLAICAMVLVACLIPEVMAVKESTLGQGAKAIKERYCPILWIEQ